MHAQMAGRPPTSHPTTPHAQPLPGITHTRFSLIRVRSPLLTESLKLFSLPTGTEMFHFPASTSTTAMNSLKGDRPSRRPGFPIRTSSDQRSVGSSPRLNAASHVLHRPSMPRHPPCALTQTHIHRPPQRAPAGEPTRTKHTAHTHPGHTPTQGTQPGSSAHTAHKKIKMLASTIQFSHNTPPAPPPTRNTPPPPQRGSRPSHRQAENRR